MTKRNYLISLTQLLCIIGVVVAILVFCFCLTKRQQRATAGIHEDTMIMQNTIIKHLDSLAMRNMIDGANSNDPSVHNKIRVLETEITRVAQNAVRDRTGINAVLDNELSKITIWITLIALVFGLFNIVTAIGGSIHAFHVAENAVGRIQEQIIDVNAKIENTNKSLNDAHVQIKNLWRLNDFNLRTDIVGKNNPKNLIDLLKSYKRTLSDETVNDNLSMLQTLARHLDKELFSEWKYMNVTDIRGCLKALDELKVTNLCFATSDTISSAKLREELVKAIDETIKALDSICSSSSSNKTDAS